MATRSTYEQTLELVRDGIVNLDLPGLSKSQIKIRKYPWDKNKIHTGITISWDKEVEDVGTNERDDIGYPCVITMVSGTTGSWNHNVDEITIWRREIFRKFHNRRLLGVVYTGTNNLVCKARHGTVSVPSRWQDKYDVGQVIVTAWFRETRANE